MRKLLFVVLLLFITQVYAEDGSRLWLRFSGDGNAQVTTNAKGATVDIAVRELREQWKGAKITLNIARTKETNQLGDEGYLIQGNRETGVSISSSSEKGLLYGSYQLLRWQETGLGDDIHISESPCYELRILNHWDNLDRTIERGYAGQSLWEWEKLPSGISPRYEAYARANASIGINGAVLNNVNAPPQILSREYLEKVKALADIFRPYGIKTYLAINFSSPAELGGLPTSDPLNKEVNLWWKNKVKEIYKFIPDFGGFLVKANSEGLPGPQDFGRTHADGANMLADALKPYKGTVMWRAFVYNPTNEDRAKQAYQEFTPLDGQFRDNVIIQIKNGPVDFQPREPFSPLFGAMKKTAVMPELQITQEYLGFSNHTAYLATLWKECLNSDTYQQGKGSTVARVTDGSIYPQKHSAIAGVANIGTDVNWCGHQLAQANWYAFGRLAWNHELTPEDIVNEWITLTFGAPDSQGNIQNLNPKLSKLMLESRETVVSYMMPLGLHHIFALDHHYGPEPWCDVPGARPDWMPKYYHQADVNGLGFDRSSKGSNAVSQYHSPWKEELDRPETCPENVILWFHHLPWDYTMKSGRTLWDELCYTYDRGVQQARILQKIWDELEPYMDAERFREVQSKFKIQTRDAVWWKDGCLLYFQEFSKRPIPYDIERPVHELDKLKSFRMEISITEKADINQLYNK
ncbi:MAG: Extracellular xylan exo-alpha-(1-_2)-glucuronosidase [Candidatus Ordinivivax streblomastigis]|uniref:Extracellular xylan exo-alpha-(1->2)-glucuronosidase n=1 Tax=Candidatus Ordinivivax streblomastigis TaxID=2540710 RepID=A0A5M8NUL3_9BACT|nr:MAG: Extracellular xylan exo-alpha-(1->2)-glucuronosidase [Candidatus Ordinivivax streblomastigis]